MAYINLNIRKHSDRTDHLEDVMTDIQYLRKSSQLIAESLQRGFDIMQMENGDIIVTEIKTVNIKYIWNSRKRRFERVTTGRAKRARSSQADDFEDLSTDSDIVKIM